jgi:hypothetical protein
VALWSLVILLGLGACAAMLAATVPVRFAIRTAGLPIPPEAFSGTVWHGEVQIADGHTATWHSRGLESLLAARFIADLRLAGPGTDLAATVRYGNNRLEIGPVAGTAAWPALQALLPMMEIRCTSSAEVSSVTVTDRPRPRVAAGQINISAGTCDRVDGTVTGVPVPALTIYLGHDVGNIIATVVAAQTPDVPLARAELTQDDRVRITIYAAGAAMVPGLPSSADSQIDLPLGLLIPGLGGG